jgi:hypothetical protein
MKQKLSAQARRDKAARDLATAKTPARRMKKAENQRRHRVRILVRRVWIGIIKTKDGRHPLKTGVMTD